MDCHICGEPCQPELHAVKVGLRKWFKRHVMMSMRKPDKPKPPQKLPDKPPANRPQTRKKGW